VKDISDGEKMKRIRKALSRTGVYDILRSNEGASLVLVSIIAIIIITGVIILRITTSSLWASADKQAYQDQAYELATSMGESVDYLILNGKVPLSTICTSTDTSYTIVTDDTPGLPNSKVIVSVTKTGDDTGVYEVRVQADVAQATYIYTATYTGNGSYTRQY
jgi:hypothetical protein